MFCVKRVRYLSPICSCHVIIENHVNDICLGSVDFKRSVTDQSEAIWYSHVSFLFMQKNLMLSSLYGR